MSGKASTGIKYLTEAELETVFFVSGK